MALCSFARTRLLPENNTQPRINPRMVIVHSQAGRGSLYNYWLSPSSKGLECHFWVAEDGRIEQYIDTHVRADANGQANGYAISIETESSVQSTERWNPVQAAALLRLLDWICTTERIPRNLSTTATGTGISFHVQYGAPGPWTRAVGKICPGPARIAQLKAEILPALGKMVAGTGKVIASTANNIAHDTGELTMAQIENIDRKLVNLNEAVAALRQGVVVGVAQDADGNKVGSNKAVAVRLAGNGPAGSGLVDNDVWVIGPGWRCHITGTGGPHGEKQQALNLLAFLGQISDRVAADPIDPVQIIGLPVVGSVPGS